ncbi:MAG: class I SAM-dependent methyltransferase [Desulfobulbaceae bacterium]|nr:class I SAM-dependent methyltransferase [Desulfobulbaceae bacterium]
MKIITDYPVAKSSPDHITPKGAVNDNTHCPAFVIEVEKLFKTKITLLDLGCAGGGLVADFLNAGHTAAGVEGSDKPRALKLGEWENIPSHLYTADITKPFHFTAENKRQKFHLVTAWEVLEHISEADINTLINTIKENLYAGGFFIASVACFPDPPYHVTVKPKEWWAQKFENAGFVPVETGIKTWPRAGSFHLTLKKAK